MSKKFLYVNADNDYEESPGAYESSDHISTFSGSANEPIITNASGYVDISLINTGDIEHHDLNGLGDDDHTQYILVAGTRAFSGNQDMGGNLLTGLGAPSSANDATRKAYVDAVAQGLRPKGNVEVATVANVSIATAPAAIDGITLSSGDRVLVWKQTDAKENGIYDFNGSGSAMTRSADQDNNPLSEIVNGVFIPRVLQGATYADEPFVIISVGTGTEGVHTIGTDDIDWDLFTSPTRLTAGNGIDISSNVVSVDLLDSNSGLAFLGTSTDELAIDFSTAFNDAKAVKAEDLNSTTNGEGASIIGIEDAGSYTSYTNAEDCIQELYSLLLEDGVIYNAGAAGVAKGDMVYVSAANTVLELPIAQKNKCIGVALSTETSGNPVKVLANDTICTGVLTSLTPTVGQKIYWSGTALSLTAPAGSGSYVWMAGIAKNANDLHVEVSYIKKNS